MRAKHVCARARECAPMIDIFFFDFSRFAYFRHYRFIMPILIFFVTFDIFDYCRRFSPPLSFTFQFDYAIISSIFMLFIAIADALFHFLALYFIVSPLLFRYFAPPSFHAATTATPPPPCFRCHYGFRHYYYFLSYAFRCRFTLPYCQMLISPDIAGFSFSDAIAMPAFADYAAFDFSFSFRH